MTIEQIVIVILAVVLAVAVVGLIVLLVRYQSLKKKGFIGGSPRAGSDRQGRSALFQRPRH